MKDSMNRLIVIFVTTMLYVADAVAGDFHPLDDIRKSAKEFATKQIATVEKNSVIGVGYLDTRLHLPLCNRPLSTEQLGQHRNSANITVTVKCQSEKPWSVHVPVKISTFSNVFIAARPLVTGAVIQLSDIQYEKRETSQLRNGYYENVEEIVGRRPKRSLVKGATISPKDLEQNKIIQRGNKVTIIARNNNITVKMPGKALDDAVEGGIIKVENLSSKRVIEAVALRPGIVEVQM